MGHLAFGNLAKIRGLITYSISPYEQRAMAGVISKGIPNTVRRFKESLFVLGVPMLMGYITYLEATKIHKTAIRKNPADYECDE